MSLEGWISFAGILAYWTLEGEWTVHRRGSGSHRLLLVPIQPCAHVQPSNSSSSLLRRFAHRLPQQRSRFLHSCYVSELQYTSCCFTSRWNSLIDERACNADHVISAHQLTSSSSIWLPATSWCSSRCPSSSTTVCCRALHLVIEVILCPCFFYWLRVWMTLKWQLFPVFSRRRLRSVRFLERSYRLLLHHVLSSCCRRKVS